MEIGENVPHLYQGKKEWSGDNSEIIFFSKNEFDLIISYLLQEFPHDAKDMRMLEAKGKIAMMTCNAGRSFKI
jgi:hypothetical protein